MTQEIKDKLQQAADKSTEKGYSSEHPAKWHYKDGFTNGAQAILENPSEWGLVEKRLVDEGIQLRIETIKTCEETHLKNEKYKEALEHVLQLLQARRPHTPGLGAPINIIKSVLEQEDTK